MSYWGSALASSLKVCWGPQLGFLYYLSVLPENWFCRPQLVYSSLSGTQRPGPSSKNLFGLSTQADGSMDDELLGLCSGGFSSTVAPSQPLGTGDRSLGFSAVPATQSGSQDMSELLGLCSGQFTCASTQQQQTQAQRSEVALSETPQVQENDDDGPDRLATTLFLFGFLLSLLEKGRCGTNVGKSEVGIAFWRSVNALNLHFSPVKVIIRKRRQQVIDDDDEDKSNDSFEAVGFEAENKATEDEVWDWTLLLIFSLRLNLCFK